MLPTSTSGDVKIASKVKIGDTEYSVTSILDGAFMLCTSLEEITIPSSVTSIGGYAFIRCTSLSSITIPNSVTSIGNAAFSNTPWLTAQQSLNNGIVIINNILYDATTTTLTNMTIPSSVTSIGTCAFKGCTSLSSITIPNSVTSIGSQAFSGCTSLSSITIPNGVSKIEMGIFSGCSNLSNIYIESKNIVLGSNATMVKPFYIALGSTIYVRNADVASALEGTYDSSLTTVSSNYNWTAPTE